MVKKRRRKKRRRTTSDFGFEPDFTMSQLEIPRIEIPKIEYPILEIPERKPINPNKLSKIQLVSILARSISPNQLYSALIKLGRHRLAEEFKSELERINEKYGKMKAAIEGEMVEEGLSSKLLQTIVEEIIARLEGIYRLSTKPLYEKEFQIQLEAFLAGVFKETVKRELERLGLNVKIKREFKLPHFKRRIDLMITIGGLRIGIEVKYSLREVGVLQRLLGQIDEYAPYCDTLIVAVYKDVPSHVLQEIKNKEKMVGKPIRVVTPTKVW